MTRRHESIPVLDLFAGPGGLGEGFAALRGEDGRAPFSIALSIEKHPVAHATLQLRSFCRQFERLPGEYYEFLCGRKKLDELLECFPGEASRSADEALCLELGGEGVAHDDVMAIVNRRLQGAEPCVLIGGPPCQAYSLAGRSRNRGVKDYDPEKDRRHYLYQEYLRVIADVWPAVFVMENVPGLCTATVKNDRIFEQMLDDLRQPGKAFGEGAGDSARRYSLHSFVQPEGKLPFSEALDAQDFIISAERHGVPQARHRLIILGVRDDVRRVPKRIRSAAVPVSAASVLEGLPRLRSGLSQMGDSDAAWLQLLKSAAERRWFRSAKRYGGDAVHAELEATLESLVVPEFGCGADVIPGEPDCRSMSEELRSWLVDPRLPAVRNHISRRHMPKDLHRYLYAACYSKAMKRSPTLIDFPPDLHPRHSNLENALKGGYFDDRFRVQGVGDKPSTTVTCHIAKDGHYYIHPDPSQCRSLTVREVARLQTFPDNYVFAGPRTAQYVQVGNAVPPFLARQLAKVVLDLLKG